MSDSESKNNFLTAGQELEEFRKKLSAGFKDDDDDLLSSTPKRKKDKKTTDKKKKKKKDPEKQEQEKEKPSARSTRASRRALDPEPLVCSDEDDVILDPEEKQMQEIQDRETAAQQNLKFHFRLKEHYNAISGEATDEDFRAFLAKSANQFAHETSGSGDALGNTTEHTNLLVRWEFSSKHKSFILRKFQTLETIYQFYANQEKVPLNKIVLEARSLDGVYSKILTPSMLADSIQYEGVIIIDGCLLQEGATLGALDESEEEDDDKIEIKVQQGVKRQFISFRVGLNEPLGGIMREMAERLGRPLEQLCFTFDGDKVKTSQTPEDLEMEGGEMLDLRVIE